MEITNFNFWVIVAIFLVSLGAIVYQKRKKVEAQFVVTTGIIMMVFYTICFLSGICTILNFLWRWIL